MYKSPGVKIEELPARGPIVPLGTSTAAFVGPALMGPLFEPRMVTNFNQFRDLFGEAITTPRHFMAYAVYGFFNNGGTTAYVVRVGTAARAFLDLDDRAGGTSLHVEALEEGPGGNLIQVQVQDAQIVTAQATRPTATVANGQNNLITVTNAVQAAAFRPGDIVTIDGTPERVTIDRVRGADIFLTDLLAAAHNAGTLRIADLAIGQTSFRVAAGAGLEVGSTIEIAQGATNENKTVAGVSGDRITLSTPLANAYTMDGADPTVDVTSFEFNLVIARPGFPNQVFSNLAMDARHSRFAPRVVDSQHVSVTLPEPPSVAAPPDDRPQVIGLTNLANGQADDLSAINAGHYTDGLDTLRRVDDVNMIAIPDRTDATVQQAMITHCESMADRFAVLDPAPGAAPLDPGGILDQRAQLESARGFAALYYPRISIPDISGGTLPVLAPPSGHMMGIYARVDASRGVHKAPANEIINGALALERTLTDGELGELNIAGINVIRTFPSNARPMVWGARTTAPALETPWRYINVRRLVLNIEESIQEALRVEVFAPNNIGLWQRLDRTIREYLTRVWRSGALFGATADEAFYVKVDEELNPASVRAMGQVIVEIGIAPTRPAEIIVIRIGQWDGGSSVSEG